MTTKWWAAQFCMRECLLGRLVQHISRNMIGTMDWYGGEEEWGLTVMFTFNLICSVNFLERWSVIMANLRQLSLTWLSLLSRAFAGEISDAGIVKGSVFQGVI